MKRLAVAGTVAALVGVVLGVGAPAASASTLPDGGGVAGTVTITMPYAAPQYQPYTYTFGPVALVGTVQGVTDVFTLTGLVFTVVTPYPRCSPSTLGCQDYPATGPVLGSSSLTGAQGSSASCTGGQAAVYDQVLEVAAIQTTVTVALSCTSAAGTVAVALSMVVGGAPPVYPVPSPPLAVAGVFA